MCEKLHLEGFVFDDNIGIDVLKGGLSRDECFRSMAVQGQPELNYPISVIFTELARIFFHLGSFHRRIYCL